jgi:hypothetical protein
VSLIRVARSCTAIPHKLGRSIPVTDIPHRIVRHDAREFVDALIRSGPVPDDSITPLLELRHRLADDSVPLPRLLSDSARHDTGQVEEPCQDREPQGDGDPVLSSLEQFLRIAGVVNEYFSIARSPQQWTEGLESGLSYRDADLLAEARAALAIDPREADWRLRRAADILGITPPGSCQVPAG